MFIKGAARLANRAGGWGGECMLVVLIGHSWVDLFLKPSYTFQRGLWMSSLAAQVDVPGLSEERPTSGSQLNEAEVRGEISEGGASRV